MARFVLLHSPLVGPTTWSLVRDELVARGHAALIPSLVGAARGGDHREVVRVAARVAAGADVLVGHSGAGPLLPAIAASVRPGAIVFVDAGVPSESAPTPLVPDALLAHLRGLAVDGALPPWSEWFGADAMAALLPDPALRAAVAAEMPRLPLAYFEAAAVEAPPIDGAAGYVLLSAPYEVDAAEARRRGWPVRSLASTHLGVLTHAPAVTDAIIDVAHP